MVFNSYIFILAFLPVTIIGYFYIGKRAQSAQSTQSTQNTPNSGPMLAFLLAMSGIFMAWTNIWYLVVLLLSIGVNYILARAIEKCRGREGCSGYEGHEGRSGYEGLEGHEGCKEYEGHEVRAKGILITGVILNILALLVFKYSNFFIDTLNSVFKTDLPMANLLLPLGISFYTFGNIAYLVDVYRKDCKAGTFLEFAAYTSFFPKLIQGPITRKEDLLPQLTDKKNWTPNIIFLSKGLYRFVLGLGKKVLLADTLALIADTGYRNFESIIGFGALLAVLSYSLQIYFDFSGYTDMAIGVAMMMNIELPENFNSPYKSKSVSQFWDRWHISLTKFFTKYLYIPMGGSRVALPRVLLNVMIVFLVSGLWHGDNWTFVIWGGLHGLLMIMERLYRTWTKSNSLTKNNSLTQSNGLKQDVAGNKTEIEIQTEVKNETPVKNTGKTAQISKVTVKKTGEAAEKTKADIVRNENTTDDGRSLTDILLGPIKTLITFVIVTVLWSLFRADSLYQFETIWRKLFVFDLGELMDQINPDMVTAISELVEVQILGKFIPEVYRVTFWSLAVIAIPLLGLIICWFFRNSDLKTKSFRPTVVNAFITVGLLVWCILSLSNVTQFIYSNF